MKSDQKRWDEKYKTQKFVLGRKANSFLMNQIGSLQKGRALDIAAGEGRNALFLALRGFNVDAVDISAVGLRKTHKLASTMRVRIHAIQADLDTYHIEEESYDLITDFYYLNRRLIPRIRRGLKKGGKVVFETYLLEHRELNPAGPTNPKYFLKPNELLNLFKGFRILFYREGIFREGGKKKAVASLVAEKP